MEKLISELRQLRMQMVDQQSLVNKSIMSVDVLIDYLIGGVGHEKIGSNGNFKRFPSDVTSKRDKLEYILVQAGRQMSAKEVKAELMAYGEDLLNVDQNLVNLERAEKKMIGSKMENGRKYYFKKK